MSNKAIESEIMAGDLLPVVQNNKKVSTEEFIGAVAKRLRKKLHG
jgi:isocitrate dehydrogenase